MKNGKKDIAVLVGLLLVLFLFLLPLLAGWEKMFFDDIAFDIYPQQVFLARSLKDGSIPWSDPHTCAGARTYYSRMFQSALYPTNWLFLAAGLLGAGSAYFWLIKAPLAFHFLLAAFFAFIFARRGLRLHRLGAAVLAISYALSPALIGLSSYPQTLFAQAWLPLLCLCLTAFTESRRFGWVLLGAIAFGLCSSAGEIQFVFQVILISALFGVGWAVLAVRRGDWAAARRLVIGGLLIFGLGFLFAGVYWANSLEGIRLILSGDGGKVEDLTGPHQSIYPLYLVTLLIPDFFGGITNHHNWGAAYHIHLTLNDSNLLGGLATIFLVVTGLRLGFRRKADSVGNNAIRSILWLFIALFGLGIVLVLGPYTFLYRLLRAVIPVFGLPYPARLRSIECFALAGLLGCSTSLLWTGLKKKERIPVRPFLIYLGATLGLAGVAFLWPYRTRYYYFAPGYRHLEFLHDWSWFIGGPILYLLLVAILLLLAVRRLRGRYLAGFLVLLVVGEVIFFAYGSFYRSRLLNRRDEDISAVRYRGPEDHPAYRVVGEWDPGRGSSKYLYRRGYFRSYYDNLAWVNGSFSIIGFDLKPLMKNFETAIKEVTEGNHYELRPKEWSSRFWTNMSVRYVLTESPPKEEGMEPLGEVGPFHASELTGAMPRFYFQDRWLPADEEKQLNALLDYDLKDIGYCADEVWRIRPHSEDLPRSEPMEEAEFLEHFRSLQEENRIVSADLSSPNRIALEVEVSRPCMLVMTDVWHPDWRVVARGYPAVLHRVNYLQSGVWCRPGRYRIVMEFLPASLRKGLAMTWLGVCGLLVLIVILRRQRGGNEKLSR